MSGEDPTSGPGFDFSRDPFVEQELLDSISDQLEESEFERVQQTLDRQQSQISDLQQQLADVQTERETLQQEVDNLTRRNADLQEQLAAAPDERVQFDATEVFSEFGTALDNAQTTLAERDLGYEVSDLNVRLRTNVVGTEGGVKFQFPGLDEQVTPEKLSEFDFQLQPRVTREGADYREIPSVVGMRLADAKSLLGDRGFEPTVVERQPGDEPDTVREQFPSPRSLAEPGTTVDLVVTTDRSDEPTEEGETEETSDSEGAESEPSDGTGESGDGTAGESGDGTAGESGDGTAGETDEEPVGEPDSEPTEATGEEEPTDVTGGPIGAGPSIEEVVEPVDLSEPRRQLQGIRGIGPTYAERLREAGIDDIVDLAGVEPERAAEATSAPVVRVRRWRERARETLQAQGE